jgi:hypothetical protein
MHYQQPEEIECVEDISLDKMIIHRNIHNILTDDDYGIQGEYLISIWTENSNLGKQEGGEFRLTPSGEVIERLWKSIPEHFHNVSIKEHIIADDKFYGIIKIDLYGKNAVNKKPVYHSISHFEITFGLLISQKNPFLTEGSVYHITNWLKASSLIECQKNDPNFSWKPGYYEYRFQKNTADNNIDNVLKTEEFES